MGKRILGRKNITIGLLTSCLFFVFLTGCGDAKYDTYTICFEKEGAITEYVVEDFDTSLYNFDEFKAQAEEEVNNYNAVASAAVKMSNVELADNKVSLKMEYPSDDAFYDMNAEPLFYGTVASALKAGYSLMTPLYSTADGSLVAPSELQQMGESRIVIFNTAADVNTYKDIAYTSDNVVLGDDHTHATVSGEKTAYIVFD